MSRRRPRRFRHDYLDFAALTRQLQDWVEAHPEHARLRQLGESAEGRPLWLLSVGPADGSPRPAVWVDGNMHAGEISGSSVALAVAEAALALHTGGTGLPDLPAPVLDAAREVTFHILPRLSPDGAEAVLQSGRYVRSVPRDARRHASRPRWLARDIDGDGLALSMRVEDPAGDYVESAGVPGLMRPRELDDGGPFYRLYPEGVIEPFDGHTLPAPDFLGDNHPDLNRNFPWQWAPEERQAGAGPYPLSEPESRAVAAFVEDHPEIFAWLNLHTFGGVFIRPPGDRPDTAMDRGDLAVYRQLAHWAEQLTGYPTVSGHEEFTYEPGKPLCGDLTDYAYHQRGCLAVVCELWDLFHQLGIERRRPFVDHYTHLDAADLEALGRWDRRHNRRRILRPWRQARHPQLGPVEVGGWDPRVGVTNPPYAALPGLCDALAALWLRVAALTPRLHLGEPVVTPLGNGTHRVAVTVRNAGYLSTAGLPSARHLKWNHPPEASLTGGAAGAVPPGEATRRLPHLRGWGRGRFAPGSSLFHPFSPGNRHEHEVAWVVEGTGRITIAVEAPRAGRAERDVVLG